MSFPLVLDLAAPGARIRVPVVVTCRVLGFSKQAFYKWKKNPVSQRDWDDAHLINVALDIHQEDTSTGSSLMNSPMLELKPVNEGCGGCAPSSGSGQSSLRKRASGPRLARRCMMIWLNATSPPAE
jgi:hypothetical protein